jgi:hypothetical protein
MPVKPADAAAAAASVARGFGSSQSGAEAAAAAEAADLDAIMDAVAAGVRPPLLGATAAPSPLAERDPHDADATAAAGAAACAAAAPSAGTLAASVCATLAFSRVKDFVLGRGEERRGGGRRRVVMEALRELTAAARVAAEFEPTLREMISQQQKQQQLQQQQQQQQGVEVAGAGQGSSASVAPVRPSGTPLLPNRSTLSSSSDQGPAAAATAAAADAPGTTISSSLPPSALAGGWCHPSPGLVQVATGGVTLVDLLATAEPLTAAALKHRLTRSRDDEAAFPRRLQLLAALNVVRTRALLKSTGRFVAQLFYSTRYLREGDAASADVLCAFMLRDDPTWLIRLTAWASQVGRTPCCCLLLPSSLESHIIFVPPSSPVRLEPSYNSAPRL